MKKVLLSIFALLFIGSIAKAEEGYNIKNVDLPKGGEAELQVEYNFEARDCKGLQFNIDLPAGLQFVKDKSEKVAYVQGFESKYECTVDFDKTGSLLVSWYSSDGTPIPRKIGILVALKVKESSTSSVGEIYNCKLRDAVRTLPNSDSEYLDDCEFTVTITDPIDYVLLDENSLFEPEDGEDLDILVKRTINPNEWSTLCLPFNIDKNTFKSIFGDAAILAEFDKFELINEEELSVNFNEVDLTEEGFEANTPYLIKPSKDVTSFEINASIEVDDVKEGSSGRGRFYGTYKACTPVPEDNLFLSNNNFYYSSGLTMMKAFRGYFYFKTVLKDRSSASTRAIINFNDGTTSISNISFLGDGNGKVYSLTGKYMGEKGTLKSLPKGVYIVDGVKVVNK
jgi:hypothetical protein